MKIGKCLVAFLGLFLIISALENSLDAFQDPNCTRIFRSQFAERFLTESSFLLITLFSAVVYHHGKAATGGHYTTDIYHIGVNGWIQFDDSTVRKLPQGRDETFKHVPNRVPYLLYYRRCDLLQ